MLFLTCTFFFCGTLYWFAIIIIQVTSFTFQTRSSRRLILGVLESVWAESRKGIKVEAQTQWTQFHEKTYKRTSAVSLTLNKKPKPLSLRRQRVQVAPSLVRGSRLSDDMRHHQRDEQLLHPANTVNNGRKDTWVFRRWAAQKLLQAGFIRLALALAGWGRVCVCVGDGGVPSISCFYLSAQWWWGPACASIKNVRGATDSDHSILYYVPKWKPRRRRACECFGDGMRPLLMMPSDCASPGYEHNGFAKSLRSRRTSSPYGREQLGSNANLHSVFIK